MDLLMSQPTHNETSHAQLHTLESFQWNPLVWKNHYASRDALYRSSVSEADHVAKKTSEWEPAAHLIPAGDQKLRTTPGGGLFMDPSRLAQTDKYNRRTGLDILGAVPEVSAECLYVLQRPAGGAKGKPTEVAIKDMGEAKKAPYNDSNQYVPDPAGGAKIMKKTQISQRALPIEAARPAHSMFPDSESMVLHVTAALLSDAGVNVLNALQALPAGAGTTLCVYSRTAVKVVASLKNAEKALQMVQRTMDVDGGDKRKELGTHTLAQRNIDHVVVVMRHHSDGSLLVVTAYPSDQPHKSHTAPDDDAEEHSRDIFTTTKQIKPLPTLRW
jgi:hypothetical protein